REQRLQLPVRGGNEEGREQTSDAEFGVESVGEDPEKTLALALAEQLEARCVRRKVDRERRPLMPLPMLVECGVGASCELEFLARIDRALQAPYFSGAHAPRSGLASTPCFHAGRSPSRHQLGRRSRSGRKARAWAVRQALRLSRCVPTTLRGHGSSFA